MGKILGTFEVNVYAKSMVVCIWREVNLRHVLSCNAVVGDCISIRVIDASMVSI